MKKNNEIDTKEIVKYILNFDYPTPEFYDDNPENSIFFTELIKESKKFRPAEKLFFDRECFDVAVRLIASQFLMKENHSFADTSIIENELDNNLEDINTPDLIEFTNYLGLFNRLKWSATKEYFYKINDNLQEIYDFTTISNIVEKFVLEIIDKFLLQLKTYFKYSYNNDFWYKLYQIDKDEFAEEDDYTYELESIDSIVSSILR